MRIFFFIQLSQVLSEQQVQLTCSDNAGGSMPGCDCQKECTMIYKSPSQTAGRVGITFELPSCMWADRSMFRALSTHGVLRFAHDARARWRLACPHPVARRTTVRISLPGGWPLADRLPRRRLHGNTYGSDNSLLDLTVVVALPPTDAYGDLVTDGHVIPTPHLPLPYERAALPIQPTGQSQIELPRLRPRLRPRVAAA